jgi:hypothetical protein
VNVDNPCTDHDALEFPDGRIVLLTHLRPGQRATVLQLPVQQKSPVKPESRVPLSQRERELNDYYRTRYYWGE